MMDDKDLEIENLIGNSKGKKKKVNGKAKGGRTELQLCKLLSQHFGKDFSKAPGSGARWSQVSFLPEHAKKTLTGDVCVPEKFKWVIESKGGYESDIDLNSLFDGGISRLDYFIEQSTRDSKYCGRKPIICWKRSRKPWLAMILLKDLNPLNENVFSFRIHYYEWIIILLNDLLNQTNVNFWFSKKN
jgi:hypothetical protein